MTIELFHVKLCRITQTTVHENHHLTLNVSTNFLKQAISDKVKIVPLVPHFPP